MASGIEVSAPTANSDQPEAFRLIATQVAGQQKTSTGAESDSSAGDQDDFGDGENFRLHALQDANALPSDLLLSSRRDDGHDTTGDVRSLTQSGDVAPNITDKCDRGSYDPEYERLAGVATNTNE
jgi:hypothetical protein